MSNSIDRQQAIDEMAMLPKYFDKTGTLCLDYADVLAVLSEHLPSAEPEIVRCKNCKYYGGILYSDTQFEYGECFGHEESDYTFEVKPYDFCSRAERKVDE